MNNAIGYRPEQIRDNLETNSAQITSSLKDILHSGWWPSQGIDFKTRILNTD